MKQFCSVIYARHIGNTSHNADYEVCRDFWCRMTYWIERTFDVFGRTA